MAEKLPEFQGTCEDPRLVEAGYIVCGSAGDTRWHWQAPGGPWQDGYKDEYTAVAEALRHLSSRNTKGQADE